MSAEHTDVRGWRLKNQRLRLVGEICNSGHAVFPPRDICPHCGDEATKIHEMSGKGEVYSFTEIQEHAAPRGFTGLTPYVEALVKLEEGPMILAQLTDLDRHTEMETVDGEEREIMVYEVQIGMPVEMVTKRLDDAENDTGVIPYGYKFRPPIRPQPRPNSNRK